MDIRRNIFFATANKNPAPPVNSGINVVSQGIVPASGWTQVVSDAQIPQNSRGNLVKDDYELVYTAEAPFSFPGGGLIVGFGGSPPGAFADGGCEQVLVNTDNQDVSGFFYARFLDLPDLHTGVLDAGARGTAFALGGIVIQRAIQVDIVIPCVNNDGNGVIPVAILGAADFDVTQVDPSTVQLEGLSVASKGKSGKLRAHVEDVNGDGFDDLVIEIEDVDRTFTSGSGTATLTGNLFDGTPFQGSDDICVVPTQGRGPLSGKGPPPAAGFSYAFGEEAGAPSAIAKNGDAIDISLDVDLAPFSFHPKTISGGGSFTIHYAAGGMTTGTWEATKLISFKSYGSSVDPELGLVFGGKLQLHIVLSTGEKGILRLTCTDFGTPPRGAVQGMRLKVVGGQQFKSVWPFPPEGPTQGFTFFVEN